MAFTNSKEEDTRGKDDINDMLEKVHWSVSLEGDIVSLEDYEEGNKPITTTTIVTKILCGKILNEGVVKSILSKAWGEPTNLSIKYLEPNVLMFNFSKEETLKDCGGEPLECYRALG